MKIGGPGKRIMSGAGWCGLLAAGFFACTNAKYQIIDEKDNRGPQNLGGPSQEITDTFRADKYRPLEIFFAVDTSSSLIEERQKLEDNMRSFISSFSPAGFPSVRINIIGDSTTYDPQNCPRTNNFQFPSDLSGVRMIDLCIGSYNMISRLTQYFHSTTPPELMAGAGIEVIMITDDNGQGVGNLAKDFNPKFGDQTIRVSAVAGIPNVTKPTSQCRVAMYGLEAIALTEETGGKAYDICNPDWSALMQDMAKDIQKANAFYTLKGPIDTTKGVTVSVNGTIVPRSSYEIDSTQRSLTFDASYPLPMNASIQVTYSITP